MSSRIGFLRGAARSRLAPAGLLLAAWLTPVPAAPAASPGNRLTTLDRPAPFSVGPDSPRLTTPMWFGERGVEAVVVLSIDDLRADRIAHYRDFLAPILDALREVEGRSPLSIFANTLDAEDPQIARWLEAGVRLEVHTRAHPCPLLRGSLEEARAQVFDCADALAAAPGVEPVTFRMPCCDSINSASPRFFAEVLPGRSPAGRTLAADSSILMFLDASSRAYAPFPNYAATAEGYPYPFAVGRVIWEFPIIAPSDWQAQNLRGPSSEETVADLLRGLEKVIALQGLYTLCFHPHGWIRNDQVAGLVRELHRRHGRKVRFLTCHEVLERLERNLLGGRSLRGPGGGDGGVRLLDIDADGFLDVVAADGERRESRLWLPSSGEWRTVPFPFAIVTSSAAGEARDAGVRFGVLAPGGRASALVASDVASGVAHFDGEEWRVEPSPLAALETGGLPVETARGGRDLGVRLRDADGDGFSDLLVNNDRQNAAWRWDPEERRFTPFPCRLPSRASIVDAEGRDRGLRFADLDRDGHDDLVLSNDDEYYVYLFSDARRGWARRVLHGPAGSSGALPKIVSAGRDEGAWIQDNVLYVANERTSIRPDLVEVRRFDEILKHKAEPPKEPEEALECFRTQPGFRVELVAAEPEVMDPVAFDFGPDGRLWVAEMGDYPQGEGPDAAGRVRWLRDEDGDGRAEKSVLFAPDLHFPTGVLAWGAGVLVTAAPDILYLEDTDGDGRADRRRPVFSGFGEGNHQHRVNGLHFGIDNWIYGANGDSGGAIRSAARPGADPVAIGGRDFRFSLDLERFEATSGRTQFGLGRDDFGNRFGSSNARHLLHAVLEERYLRRNPHWAPPDPVLDIPEHGPMAAIFQISPFLLSLNEIHVPGHFSSACGLSIYRGHAFPPQFHGSAFVAEPVGNLVHRDVLVPEGATFRARRGEEDSEFVASTDSWFRPVYTAAGPDGALYVADMYRWVIEHPQYIPPALHGILDFTAGRDRGRIYRVVHGGADRKPRDLHPDLSQAAAAELVELLAHPGGWWRDTAQRILVERRDPAAVAPLGELAARGERPVVRLHALWTLDGIGALEVPAVLAALEDPSPEVREHALRLAERFLPRSPALRERAARAAGDGAFRVRLQAALTLGEIAGEEAARALGAIARRDLNDPWMRAAILSSSLPHAAALLEGLFGGGAPLAGSPEAEELRAGLVRTVVGRGDPEAVERLLGGEARAPGEPERWELELLGALVEARGHEAETEIFARLGSPRSQERLVAVRRRARSLALSEGDRVEERVLAVRALGIETAGDADLLARLVAPREPLALQVEAVRTLSRVAPAAGGRAEEALVAAWEGAGPVGRGEILEALVARPRGQRVLLDALADGRIESRALGGALRERLVESGDPGVRERAAALLARQPALDRQAVVARYLEATGKSRGVVEKGREIFAAHCSPCHLLDGEGYAVGPDLSQTRHKGEAVLLEALLDPGRMVPPQFTPYTAVTRSRGAVSGIVSHESGAAVTLVRGGGIEETLLRRDILVLRPEDGSLMPADLEQVISPGEMAHLLVYLRSGPRPLEGLSAAEMAAGRREALSRGHDGLARVVRASGKALQASWVGEVEMHFARQLDGKQEVVWETEPVPRPLDPGGACIFRWPAAMGYVSQPAGKFTLYLGERRLLDFDVSLERAAWSGDEGVSLRFEVRARNREDATGLMVLRVPARLVAPGKPALLRVTGSRAESRRWFGLLPLKVR